MIKSTLTAAVLAMLLAGPAFGDDDDKRRGRGHDRDDRYDHRDDDRRDHDRRDHRSDDRKDKHWRHDDSRNDNWRNDNWRNDNWQNNHWRNDYWRNTYWRNDFWRSNRHWRHVPPVRYRADFGYRSGYELAWRDWHHYGRYDRYWRRLPSYGYRAEFSYRSGYEEGWRDAARYYGPGYRPGYWVSDPRDGWFFSFGISG